MAPLYGLSERCQLLPEVQQNKGIADNPGRFGGVCQSEAHAFVSFHLLNQRRFLDTFRIGSMIAEDSDSENITAAYSALHMKLQINFSHNFHLTETNNTMLNFGDGVMQADQKVQVVKGRQSYSGQFKLIDGHTISSCMDSHSPQLFATN